MEPSKPAHSLASAGKAPAWLEEKAEPAPVAEPRKVRAPLSRMTRRLHCSRREYHYASEPFLRRMPSPRRRRGSAWCGRRSKPRSSSRGRATRASRGFRRVRISVQAPEAPSTTYTRGQGHAVPSCSQASRGDLSEAREEHRQNREREISRASAVARPGSSAEDEEPQDEEALEARRCVPLPCTASGAASSRRVSTLAVL